MSSVPCYFAAGTTYLSQLGGFLHNNIVSGKASKVGGVDLVHRLSLDEDVVGALKTIENEES